jgi:hypothetical protein
MSIYEVVTLFLGIIVAALGFWNSLLWGQIKALGERMDKLPDTYARRDDLKDAEDKILKAISDLSSRIDTLIQVKHG